MRLLLTGATGFVGRNFLLHALNLNRYAEIILPVRSEEKLRAQLLGDGLQAVPPSVRTVIWNARDPLAQTIRDTMDGIDHCVFSAGVLYGDSQEQYWETNVRGTMKLLQQLRHPKRVVILSSQAAGGPCSNGGERTETDVDQPLTWYGKSKLEMERQVLRDFNHLNVTFLRPPMIIGPRDSATLPLFKMARFPIRVKPGQRNKFYSFIAVSDLVRAIETILIARDQVFQPQDPRYFVAHSQIISDRDLIQAAADSLKVSGFTVPIPQGLIRTVSQVVNRVPSWRRKLPSLSTDRAQDIFCDRWVVSPRKFETAFGWSAVTTLSDAVRNAKEWYQRSGQL